MFFCQFVNRAQTVRDAGSVEAAYHFIPIDVK